MDRHRVCAVPELPPGASFITRFNDRSVAVFNDGGAFFAIDDCCPHAGASLAAGHVEDGCVTCPWHAWRFRLADGAWADNPRIKTPSYPVEVDGDAVYIRKPIEAVPS
jgi:nitrite reductase (NADH) small subunit/3-phenylpropionate/trans-cinnamate dioxygenase ferredoxin subunit